MHSVKPGRKRRLSKHLLFTDASIALTTPGHSHTKATQMHIAKVTSVLIQHRQLKVISALLTVHANSVLVVQYHLPSTHPTVLEPNVLQTIKQVTHAQTASNSKIILDHAKHAHQAKL